MCVVRRKMKGGKSAAVFAALGRHVPEPDFLQRKTREKNQGFSLGGVFAFAEN